MTIPRALVGVSVITILALSGAVQAHPRLLSVTPKAGAAVASPHVIQLKFSERLIGAMTGADVVTPAMAPMPGMAGRPVVKMTGFVAAVGPDGKTLTLTRKANLPAGAYQVVWHAVAADTHRVAGRFAFSVK